jgi:hypothetical protein
MSKLPNELVAPNLFNLDHANAASTPVGFIRRSAKELGLREHWFRDAIAANPELVIGPCRLAEATDEDWYLWKTEAGLNLSDGRSGSIDVLLVSSGGRIGLVETKLSHNHEGRREVLAQLLDYAVHLPGCTLANLPALPTALRGPDISAEDVEMHLAQGDFLLVLAGDMLDRGAVRLSQAVLGTTSSTPGTSCSSISRPTRVQAWRGRRDASSFRACGGHSSPSHDKSSGSR